MFALAFLTGIYGNLILVLGLSGLLYKNLIVATSVLMFLVALIYFKKEILGLVRLIRLGKVFKNEIFKNRFSQLLILLLIVQFGINLIGAISPELAFDALWYHLTLPKIYLINNSIFHIPGGLLYYSDMPKFTELLYTLPLSFGNEIFAKIIHLFFGVLTSVAVYKLSRKFMDENFALLSVVIFYSNLVVAWQSTTAYIDLARAFFEIMSLWGFVEWLQTKNRKWLIESAFLLGLAISTKILSVFSLFIFTLLIIFKRDVLKEKIKNICLLWLCSLIVVLPWGIFSYVNTGNPVYPFFSNILRPETFSLAFLNPLNFISEMWKMFVVASDPISPLYLIFLPLILIKLNKANQIIKYIGLYIVFAVIGWYLVEFYGNYIPEIKGGTRFILPYLPAFSIIIAYFIFSFRKYSSYRILAVLLVIIISVSTIFSRGYASIKYIPYVFGQESKSEFLTKHLNFSYGDFYDTDKYFRENIKQNDKVLLIGFHNLYYVDFPFIDQSWVRKGNSFNYIAVNNTVLPNRFQGWNMIYYNPITKVQLYTLGGQEWIY